MKASFYLKFILLLNVLLISSDFLGQNSYFLKFENVSDHSSIKSIFDQLGLDSASQVEHPFTLPSVELQQTYVLKNVNFSKKELRVIESSPAVDYVEPIPQYQFFYTPNDLSGNQWNLNQINAELAWDLTTGNNVKIAMVDDAVQLSHPDLTANIWTNPGEIPNNGIDDDGNGYIDDVNGWDAANNDNDPNPPANASSSYFSHGTHCAGIAAAVTDNNTGISSIGFNSTLIPVKIAHSSTSMLTGAYAGVDYAIASGAQIISMSWGGGAYSTTYQNLFNYAHSQGIVCIAAAGNSSSSAPMYPASYNHVISVGSTNSSDQKSSFSNFGSTIDVMAPGSGIYSTVPQNGYAYKSGTSMACPLVSGLAALMIAKDPSISPDDLELCLKNTCDNIDSQNPGYIGNIGAGRINALAALQCLKPITANFESDISVVCPGNAVQFTDLSNNNPTAWEWTFPGGTPATSNNQNPIVIYPSTGNYDVTLIVHNADGSDTLTMSNYIEVNTPTATISGNTTVVSGFAANLIFHFTGQPPYSVTYTDGSNNYTVNNISSSPYYHPVSPTTNTTYSLVSMSDYGCSGSVSGSADITVVSGGNPCTPGAATTFVKTFEGPNSEYIKCVVNTQDGGVIILGKTNSFGASGYDLLVLKYDQNYQLEWQKIIGYSNDDATVSSNIIEDSNGNFLIATNSLGGSTYYAYVLKLDSSGNLIWNKTIPSSYTSYFRNLIQTANGDYVIAGTSNFFIGSSDFLIYRLDNNGNVIHGKTFGKGGNDHATDLLELPNGNILVCGAEQIAGLNRSPVVTMLDANLNILWNKSYQFTSQVDAFYNVIQKSNGNFLIGGKCNGFSGYNEEIILMEFDINGNTIWAKHYGNSYADQLYGMKENADGTVTMAAFSETNSSTNGILIFNIDGGGNIAWCKKYDTNSSFHDINHPPALVKTADGGFFLAAQEVGAGNGENIKLIKTDECGQAFCNEVDYVLNSSSVSISGVNLSYSSVITDQTTSLSYIVQDITSSSVITICDSIGATLPICNLEGNFNFDLSCAGDTIFFYDQSVDSIGTIHSWQWDFGDGNTVGGIQNPMHSYSTAGTYNVQLIVASDTLGCTDTIILPVTIPNSLTIDLANDTICLGDSITIEPNVLCGVQPYSVSWSPSTGLSNATSLNTNASPDNTTTYTLSVTDDLGNTYSEDITIFVDQNCCVSHADFNVPLQICEGDSVMITNNTITTGNATFVWDFGVNASPQSYLGQFPPSVYYSTTGTFPILLTISDDCGIDTLTQWVGINSLPELDVIEDTVLCTSSTLDLGGAGAGNNTYLWSPSNQVSDSTSSNPSTTPINSTNYTVTVTDPFTGCSASDSIEVTVFSSDIELGENDTICQGDSIQIGWVDQNGNNNWSTGATTDSITITSSGTYWLEVNLNQCSKADTISIYVHDFFVDLGADTLICTGDTITLNAGISPASYTWQDGSTGISYNAYEAGTYSVMVDQYECIATDSILINIGGLPSIFIGNDTLICIDSTLTLDASTLSSTYLWTPSGDTTAQYVATEAGTYSVDVTNICGVSTGVIVIETEDCNCIFTIPNVFTPDNDGVNDFFRMAEMNQYCEIESVLIYNRWGNLVHSSVGHIHQWDGKTLEGEDVPGGAYYYVITVEGKAYKGVVHLFR